MSATFERDGHPGNSTQSAFSNIPENGLRDNFNSTELAPSGASTAASTVAGSPDDGGGPPWETEESDRRRCGLRGCVYLSG